MFPFGIKSGKVVRYHVPDRGVILVLQRLGPIVFHLLELGRDCTRVGRFFLSVRARRGRDREERDYQKWRK
jgi:hypothetical protein